MSKPTITDMSVKDIFAPYGILKDSVATIKGYSSPWPNTPPLDLNYVPREETVREVISWVHLRQKGFTTDGLMLSGMPGAGKSSVLRFIASLFNWPVFRNTGRADQEFPELLGRPVFASNKMGNTQMEFQLGVIPNWATVPYALFIYEEFDRVLPEILVGMNSILDGGIVDVIDDNRIIAIAEGCLFTVTGNSGGIGDQSGICNTTQQVDGSSNDRFFTLNVPYYNRDEEVSIMNKRLTINGTQIVHEELIKASVEFGSKLRAMCFNSGEIGLPIPFTLRALIRFWLSFIAFKHLQGSERFEKALDVSYCNKFATPEVEHTMGLREACIRIANDIGFTHLLNQQ